MVFGPPPIVEGVVGIALISTAAVFIEASEVLRGNIDPKGGGQIMILSGIITLLCAVVNGFVLQQPSWALLALVFGIAQISFGYHNYNNLDMAGLGYLAALFAIAVWWWAISGIVTMQQYIYGGLGLWWGWIFVSLVPPTIYNKGIKLCWVTCYISTFAALLIPGLLILTGHSLLL